MLWIKKVIPSGQDNFKPENPYMMQCRGKLCLPNTHTHTCIFVDEVLMLLNVQDLLQESQY